MIEELHIRNFALIDETTVQFREGLNILTGETGAGKSVLIGALGLVLGGKADSGSIRTGCDEAEISAVFTVGTQEIRSWLSDHELDADEENLIIRRKIKLSGRGSVYIQSRPFTLAELGELGKLLVDVHGQHDHQSLFSIEQHRRFLDKSGKLENENRRVQTLFNKLKEKTEEIRVLTESLVNIEKESELLNHSIREIEDAALKEGEEEEIRNSLRRMEQAEQIYGTIDGLLALLPENRGGALSSLRRGMELLEKLKEMDPGSSGLAERYSNAFYELEDISDSISSLNDELSFSPGEKETLEDRLAVIKKVLRKYGPGIEDVLAYLEECRIKIDQLDNSTDRLDALGSERDELEKELIDNAMRLSDARKKAGAALEQSVLAVLKTLGMPSSEFSVGITQKTGDQGQALCGLNGLDRVEFLFSANKGEPLKPLKEVASGGELSRVMLGIKSALAGSDGIPVLVFDEIDAGIGGEVGSSIGRHMKKLAGFHQILCITHLASIAVYADNHIKVRKTEHDNRTLTDLFPLEQGQKVSEIARMLSGDSEGDASVSHAEELLRSASI
ncbi:MAG: DNA repair protein RecN [Spirochaetales bacterium]|nr:DNA repair protein RecN [Spirochaetales bacterium]